MRHHDLDPTDAASTGLLAGDAPPGTPSGIDVAAALIERQPGLDQMQLHKLLYCIQAANLAWFGEPAFAERIEAWQYGPVVRRVAGIYMEFDTAPIQTAARGRSNRLKDRLLWVIDQIIREFGHRSGPDLAKLVKAEGGPWWQARGDLGPESPSSNEISLGSMAEYHRRFGLNPERGLTPAEQDLAQRFFDGDRASLEQLVGSFLGGRTDGEGRAQT